MRVVTPQTAAAWLASVKGDGLGQDDRPMTRATVQRLNIRSIPYDLSKIAGTNVALGRRGTGQFRSYYFGQDHVPVEIPNIRSLAWNRSVDQDAATMKMTLWNTEVLPIGSAPDPGITESEFERPGWLTFSRGATTDAQTRWGYTTNAWRDLLVPDRIIRTYQGYGFDPAEPPERDPHLYPSGVWLIDRVTYNADATITIDARDVGRLLIDQIMFPRIIPLPEYPLIWERYHQVELPDIVSTSTGWVRPTGASSSNDVYRGRNFYDAGRPYVDSSGGVLGHYNSHAFDTNANSYWLSIGNSAKQTRSAYEWIQGNIPNGKVSAVRVHAHGGPYTVWISIYANGSWQGRATIPYREPGWGHPDNHADIRYVMQARIGHNENKTFRLPNAINNATRVRITFSNLMDYGIGRYRWRAGCRSISVAREVTTTKDGGTRTEGNYDDWTDIVKWLCAWSGLYWPEHSTGRDYQTYSDGTRVNLIQTSRDTTFPAGRVWGDLEDTGTNSPNAMGVETWDKKPVMDGIQVLRDMSGYLFYIDETGGAVWRSPNIWKVGNWLSDPDGGPNQGRTSTVIEIDENETLIDYSVSVDSANVRERVFVANSSGQHGAVSAGYTPHPSGIHRVAIWTDQNFTSQKECQIMADLLAVRQSYKWRTGRLVIPAHPGIQIDDQIRIFERVTGETYYHYVNTISSDWDADTRRWTYTMTTHWLGEQPFSRWVFDPKSLSSDTQAYLKAIGKI